MAQRVTQAPRVPVVKPDPTARVTQAVQMPVVHPDPSALVTQAVRVAVVENVAPDSQAAYARVIGPAL